MYGVDNTFLSRALDEDIFNSYQSPMLAKIPDNFKLDPSNRAIPVDYGDVCLNYDRNFFIDKNISKLMNGDSISYYIDNSELIEESDSYGQFLTASNANSFQCFYYYVKWGNIIEETSDPSKVNLVHIRLSLKKQEQTLQTVLTGGLRTK